MGRRPDDAPVHHRITPASPEAAAVAWGRVFAGDDFTRNPFVVSLGLVGAFCPVDGGALREAIAELYDLTASWSRFVAMLPRGS